MTLDAEALLVPALVAFYAKDCVLLLRTNEGILERRGARGWHVAFGSHHFTLSGRHPCLMHLLTPHRPTYRMRWAMTNEVRPFINLSSASQNPTASASPSQFAPYVTVPE